jgi:hypothetical protein
MRGTNDETGNKERRMPEQVQPMALTPEDAPAIVLLERSSPQYSRSAMVKSGRHQGATGQTIREAR